MRAKKDKGAYLVAAGVVIDGLDRVPGERVSRLNEGDAAQLLLAGQIVPDTPANAAELGANPDPVPDAARDLPLVKKLTAAQKKKVAADAKAAAEAETE